MSAPQQPQTSQTSSLPSSTTSRSEAPTATADLVIRAAETDDDIIAIHRLLMSLEHEVALLPVNPIRLMQDVMRVVRSPADQRPSCALMAIRDGQLVGTLAFTEVPVKYSDHTLLLDDWFQVHPAYRGDDVGPALLQEAQAIAEQAKKVLVIVTFNPSRRRGGKRRLVASLHRFEPSGAMLAYHPKD